MPCDNVLASVPVVRVSD